MLSEREWKILHELEHRLEAEDPALARSFSDAGWRWASSVTFPRLDQLPRWVFSTAFALSVALSILMLAALAPWSAALFMLLAIASAALRTRYHGEPHDASTARAARCDE